MQLSKLSLRTITFQAVFALGLTIASPTAEAQLRHGPGLPQAPHQADRVKVATINSYIDQRDQIDLLQVLGMNRGLGQRGARIASLSVNASGHPGATLILKLNGRQVDAARLGGYNTETQLRPPQNIRPQDRLVLSANTNVFLSTVKAVVKRGGNRPNLPNRPNVLRAQINKTVFGQETLPVRQLVQSQTGARLQGLKLDKVIVRASSQERFRQARAQLLINGAPVGMAQPLPAFEQRLVFELPRYAMNTIGQDIRTIQLRVIGNAQVKMVGLKIDQGPAHNGSFQVNVNRSFNGSQRIDLAQLIGRAHGPAMNAPLESITIVAHGSGNMILTGGASVLGSMIFNGPFSASETVASHGHVTPSEVKARIKGRITIESIRINVR